MPVPPPQGSWPFQAKLAPYRLFTSFLISNYHVPPVETVFLHSFSLQRFQIPVIYQIKCILRLVAFAFVHSKSDECDFFVIYSSSLFKCAPPQVSLSCIVFMSIYLFICISSPENPVFVTIHRFPI